MPNLITHHYIGEELRKNLNGKAKEFIDKNTDAFYLGCIGPDYLFTFSQLKFKEARYPNLMQYLHTYEIFYNCGKYLQENQNDIMLSYVLGLLCHYVADYHLHPYVNFFEEEGIAKELPKDQLSSIHTLIESAIDSHIIEEKYNSPCYKFAAHITCKGNSKIKITIGKLYQQVINKIYGFSTNPKKFSFSYLCTKMFMLASIDTTGLKKKFFDKLERMAGEKKILTGLIRPPEGYKKIDYMNRQHKEWREIRNRDNMINFSVDEMLNIIIEKSIYYINTYIDFLTEGKPLPKEDFSINFEGIKLY